MISAQRIEWNNLDSLEFDLIADVSFDSDDGNSPSFLNQDGIYTEHYDGHRTVHRAKTNEFFNPTFTFMKEGFGDFTMDERRRILSWLSTEKPGWLNVYHDDSNVISYRCFGTWESIELYKLGNGRVVGYVVTFASTHAHAFSHLMTWPQNFDNLKEYEFQKVNSANKTLDSTNTNFKIECETDEYGKVLYPKVTIKYDTDNIYLPINGDTDPTEDPSYYMIPNVIYSYTDSTNKETLRVNINGEKHVVTALTPSIQHDPNNYSNIGYCYSPDNKDIRIAVEGSTQGVYEWQSVGNVYAAVQIENKYKLNGEDKSSITWIAGGVNGETVVLDGENKIIYNKTQDDRDVVKIIGDRFNLNWLPLAYGTNDITITGNCEIKFEWVEPRKVGSL